MTAVPELEALRAKVDEAERRVREVAAAEQAAVAELKSARAHLAEVEADGMAKRVEAARQRLERARVAVEHEPWPERREVAKARVRDAHKAVAAFVRERFVELLDAKEAEGEAAAATLLSAAETLIAADRERHRVAGEISELWRMVTQPRPGDVSYVTAQRLVSEAGILVDVGADAAPRLDRDRLAQVLQAEPVPA